jgi:hypothetical protein
MFTTALLYAAVLPFAASAVSAFALLRFRVAPRHLWAASVAAGFLAAQFGFKAQTSFAEACQSILQPHEAADWLPLIVLLALGTTLLLMHDRLRLWPPMLALAAAFAVAVPVRLISGNVRLTHQWSSPEKVVYLLILALSFGLIWRILSNKNDDREALLRLPLLILVAASAAIVVTLSGALVYGLSCGAVAAALAGTAVAALVRAPSAAAARSASLQPSAAAAVITFSLGSLILLAHYFAELSNMNATLLLLALAATSVPLQRLLSATAVWQRLLLRTVLCITPLCVVVLQVAIHHLAPGQ